MKGSEIMRTLDIYENVKYLSIFNEIDVNINKITIDTRKVCENDCYIGIKGDKNDGNLFYMDAFNKGAKQVLNIVKYLNIKKALLKEKSPSCGKSEIYDGTFTNNTIKGSGITATALEMAGVTLYNEFEIEELINEKKKYN